MNTGPFEIFLTAPPGLEDVLQAEAVAAGFASPQAVPGGVTVQGGWPEVWRANLCLRGAGRVLARVAEFRAMHPAQLDKRARKLDWAALLPPGTPIRVEATCRKSRIYHAGAAAQRVEAAARDALGPPTPGDPVTVMVRIEDDLCTLSLDTSGEGLHKRGFKQAVNKAPLRETLAALILRGCGYDGREPVLDPMCGSGTLVIEAAEIAAGLAPGRGRGFAFEGFTGFDPASFATLKGRAPKAPGPDLRFHGYDRDAGAIRMSAENAARAGVAGQCTFACQPIGALQRPDGAPGLVICNPPYGGRIGNRKLLFGLYASFGQVLKERFRGWRVGFITADGGLAKATGLPLLPPGPPIAHGGLTVKLYRTAPLP